MANKKLEQSNMKPLMILEEKNVQITMQSTKKEINKGAWTREEDQKLAEVIAVHGAKKWKTIATIAGILFIHIFIYIYIYVGLHIYI